MGDECSAIEAELTNEGMLPNSEMGDESLVMEAELTDEGMLLMSEIWTRAW